MSENGTLIGSLRAALNFTKPEVLCIVKAANGIEFDAYGGLEEPNRLLFNVRSSSGDSSIQEHVIASAELSPNGQILKSEIRWRPESFNGVVDLTMNYVRLCNAQRHLEAFTRVVQGIVRKTLIQATQDFKTSLELDSVIYENLIESLRASLMTLHFSNMEYFRALAQNVCDFLMEVTKATYVHVSPEAD